MNFRFGHQLEDADDGSDLVASTPERRQRWPWTCRQCSHLNPPTTDDCETCGLEHDEWDE